MSTSHNRNIFFSYKKMGSYLIQYGFLFFFLLWHVYLRRKRMKLPFLTTSLFTCILEIKSNTESTSNYDFDSLYRDIGITDVGGGIGRG